MRLVFAAVMAVSPIFATVTTARAEPRSAKECAAIDESFAYNECIAKFGPSGAGKIVSHTPGVVIANTPPVAPVDTPPLVDKPPPSIAAPARAAAPQRAVASIYQRRANGRYFAVFQIGRSAPPTFKKGVGANVNVAPSAAVKSRGAAFMSSKGKAAAVYSARGHYRRR